jgi:prolyl-tRNA synthetase
VHIVIVNVHDEAQAAAGRALYEACHAHGLEALLDDRDERPGVKFKDADLLGMPVRITLGNAWAKNGLMEVRARRTREERKVPGDAVIGAIRELLASAE